MQEKMVTIKSTIAYSLITYPMQAISTVSLICDKVFRTLAVDVHGATLAHSFGVIYTTETKVGNSIRHKCKL